MWGTLQHRTGVTMDGVSGADFWWGRRAVTLLGLLALAELVARLTLDPASITRTPLAGSMVRAAVNGTNVRTTSGSASTQFFLLLCLLALCTTLPLAFSRAVPAALVLSTASLLSLAVFQLLPLAAVMALLIAGYRLGHSDSRELVGFLSLPFLILALVETTDTRETEVQFLAIGLAALIPTAAVAGISRRARTETRANTVAQQTIAGRWREHTVRGERARISRELHDVVAHHVSMIAVQAETARLTVPGMPSEGAKQLLSIGNTARATLAEMRRLLGVLREDTEDEAADRQPQPGLRQLNQLLDEARDASDAGIRLIVRGPPKPLEPGVELAVYRIVQESLTNARRHAPGAAVDVEMQYTDHFLRLRIRDNGPGPRDNESALCDNRSRPYDDGPRPRDDRASPYDNGSEPCDNEPRPHDDWPRPHNDWPRPHNNGLRPRNNRPGPRDNGPPFRDSRPGSAVEPSLQGHGLLGIRERAAAVGGEVRIGTAPGGGFLIEARLPTAAKDTE